MTPEIRNCQCSYFLRKIVIFQKFSKNLFLQQDTIGYIGYTTKTLTGMSYLTDTGRLGYDQIT